MPSRETPPAQRRSNDALREWAHAEAPRSGRRRISVNPYKESIPIFTCASIFADAVVQMPIRIYSGKDRKTAKEVTSGPAVKLFERPNEIQEQPDFIRTVALQCALGGSTKIQKIGESSRTRIAEQLIPLGANGATPKRPGSEKYALDGWMIAGSRKSVEPWEIVLVKYADDPDDPLMGVSPVGVARRSIEMGVLGLERNRSLLERDGRKDGGLFYKGVGTLDDDQVAQVQAELEENSGPDSAGVVPIFSGDFEYRSFSMSMRDLEWAAAMKLDLEGACRIYRIPPIFAGIYDNAGWAEAGVKTQENLLYRNAVLPFINRLEQSLTLGVLRPFDPMLSVWFDRDAVDALREDINAKLETSAKLLEQGWTQNQVNETLELGMPETEWGDESFIESGKTTRTAVIEMATLPPIDDTPDPAVDGPPETPPTDGENPVDLADPEQDPPGAEDITQPDEEQTASLEFPHLTNAQLKQWRGYMRALQGDEKKILGRVRRNLLKQRARVLSALRGNSQRAKKKPDPNDIDAAEQAFDPKDLSDQILPLIEETFTKSSVTIVAELAQIGIASDEALNILETTVPKLASSYREKRMGITVEIGENIKAAVGKTLAQGYSNGENLSEMIGRIQRVFNAGAQRARTIARTEVNSANNNARLEIMSEAGVARKEWLTSPLENVRDSHVACGAEGPIPFSSKFSNGLDGPHDPDGPPGEVINCVLPGTLVSGRPVAAIRALYAGKAVEIETRRGHRVAMTVNHPVLTANGIIPAHALKKGDHVVGERIEAQRRATRRNAEDQQSKARVEDVFDALAAHGSRWSRRARAFDLDGDGRFVRQQIDGVVGLPALPDRSVVRDLSVVAQGVTTGAENRGQFLFVQPGRAMSPTLSVTTVPAFPRLAEVALDRRSIFAHSAPLQGFSLGTPADLHSVALQDAANHHAVTTHALCETESALARDIRGDDLGVSLLRDRTLRVGGAAQCDATLPEQARHDTLVSADFARELMARFPGQVAADEIISVRHFDYVGHVFDLQDERGWFNSGGVLSRNCRCVLLARAPE